MLAHCSHVRLDAKRTALDALTMAKGKRRYFGAHIEGYDTKVSSNLPFMPQIIDYLVELSGIEPLTSSLRIQDATLDGETPDDTE
jgi:hypothetical protein